MWRKLISAYKDDHSKALFEKQLLFQKDTTHIERSLLTNCTKKIYMKLVDKVHLKQFTKLNDLI